MNSDGMGGIGVTHGGVRPDVLDVATPEPAGITGPTAMTR